MVRRLVIAATLAVTPLLAVAGPPATAGAEGVADRIVNDPRVTSLTAYGLNLPPQIRSDKSVQFGKALRIVLAGHPDFWRIGVVSPTLKPVGKGDRITIAFWARAAETQNGAPGKIGRVQLETTPVFRTIFEKSFDVAPEWKLYQVSGTADANYPAGGLNAALHLDSARQVLEIGPVFILDDRQPQP